MEEFLVILRQIALHGDTTHSNVTELDAHIHTTLETPEERGTGSRERVTEKL